MIYLGTTDVLRRYYGGTTEVLRRYYGDAWGRSSWLLGGVLRLPSQRQGWTHPAERVFGVLENDGNGDPLGTVSQALGVAEGMTYAQPLFQAEPE